VTTTAVTVTTTMPEAGVNNEATPAVRKPSKKWFE
jgi:hypothetical protein